MHFWEEPHEVKKSMTAVLRLVPQPKGIGHVMS